MAKRFPALLASHRAFVAAQRIFFTASAAPTGRVNVSPRPTDAFRVIDDRTVCYRDLTGSGSETSAHLRVSNRLTIMFCAFEGPPTILRIYGEAESHARGTSAYRSLLERAFESAEPPGSRQIVLLRVDLVQTSCGFGVPLFDYVGERDTLARWAETKGESELETYRREKNAVSLDGFPTGLVGEA